MPPEVGERPHADKIGLHAAHDLPTNLAYDRASQTLYVAGSPIGTHQLQGLKDWAFGDLLLMPNAHAA